MAEPATQPRLGPEDSLSSHGTKETSAVFHWLPILYLLCTISQARQETKSASVSSNTGAYFHSLVVVVLHSYTSYSAIQRQGETYAYTHWPTASIPSSILLQQPGQNIPSHRPLPGRCKFARVTLGEKLIRSYYQAESAAFIDASRQIRDICRLPLAYHEYLDFFRASVRSIRFNLTAFDPITASPILPAKGVVQLE